ncbi:hypothetical protein BCR34DRAFT_263256 [Clohesyomyces aquaticus]|uniref:Uncharacterized protein n=1 Tax=Clohesyomyces aquaticus TaxID=1231657 RepID=A0A1Y1ZTU0_9PLEO|nr:hypothetical protein BCR34DRAFT_263256 [Clohesyomyces aquaticus]
MDYDEYTFTPRAFGQNSAVGREFPDGGGVRLPTSRNVSSPASDETVTPSKDSARSHFPVPKSNYRTNSMPTLSTGTEAFGQHADFPSSPLMNVGRSGATQADYGLEMGASAESFRDRQDFISSAEDYMSTYSQFSNVESEAYYSARLNISSAEDATAKIVMTEKNIQSNNSSTIIGRVDTDRFLPGPSTYRRRQDRTTSLPFIPSPLAQSTFAAGHGYNGPRTPTSAISPGTIGDGRPPSGR